jgi:hypothetical protein
MPSREATVQAIIKRDFQGNFERVEEARVSVEGEVTFITTAGGVAVVLGRILTADMPTLERLLKELELI